MTNGRLGTLSAAVLALLLGACAARKPGTGVFSPDGYKNHLYGYHVSGSEDQLLSPEWKLENHYKKGTHFEVKDHYLEAILIDQNDDGKIDKLDKHPSADLEFRHLEHDGSIWLATMPLSQDQDRTELRVMLQRMVNAISGATTTGAGVATPFGVFSESKETRLAARVLSQAPAKVSGYPAHVLLLETANADQLDLNPDARWRRAEIVLVRTDYTWNGGGAGPFPVFLVAGYSNFPDDFDRGVEDFHRFISHLTLDVRRLKETQEARTKECAPGTSRIRVTAVLNKETNTRKFKSLDITDKDDDCLAKALSENQAVSFLSWDELNWVVGGIREGTETTVATPSTDAEPSDTPSDPASTDSAPTDSAEPSAALSDPAAPTPPSEESPANSPTGSKAEGATPAP